jgi:hypothetical protein
MAAVMYLNKPGAPVEQPTATQPSEAVDECKVYSMTVAEAKDAIRMELTERDRHMSLYMQTGLIQRLHEAERSARNAAHIRERVRRCHGYTDEQLGVTADDLRIMELQK